ncbi:protein kinase family protein [Nocardiopsis dassonvillei]|uniref:hypothetical protein n=1 Tax=Nocardiopsis dassonvillei TaxID=2014 RepID=UPI003672D092
MSKPSTPGMAVTRITAEEEGATSPMWGTAEVLLKTGHNHPNVVANEYIANRLAYLYGVPVPVGDVWINPEGQRYWVCGALRQRGHELPPPSPADLGNISDQMRARMIVFDTWILNTDRHDGNILCDRRGNAWLIDHDRTLFDDADTERGDRLHLARERRPGYSVLVEDAPPPQDVLRQAGDKLRFTVSELAIEGVVRQARAAGLINAQEGDDLQVFLQHRRDEVHRLLPDKAGIPSEPGYTSGMLDFEEGEQG